MVESAELNFTSHDAAGNILASALSFVGPIPPGETRATQSFADYFGSEASVDIFVNDVRFTVEDPGFSLVRIVSNNWRADPQFGSNGAVVWAVEVENTSTFPIESVGVSIVTYDATGQILTTSMTFVGPLLRARGDRLRASLITTAPRRTYSSRFRASGRGCRQPDRS